MEEIKIRDEFIKLGQLLKLAVYGRRWSRGKVCDHRWPGKG